MWKCAVSLRASAPCSDKLGDILKSEGKIDRQILKVKNGWKSRLSRKLNCSEHSMEPVLTSPTIALCCELLSLFYPLEPVRHIDLLSNFLTRSESRRLWRGVAGCDFTFIEKNICNLRAASTAVEKVKQL